MMGSQLSHQGGGTLGSLARLGCTAKIFVGDCADGLAQFERVHLVSFFGVQYKNSIDAMDALPAL